MLPALLLLPLLLPQPQDPPLLQLPSLTITRTEYLHHLYSAIGGARLEDLVLDKALALELERLGPEALARAGAATRGFLRDPDARARALVDERVLRDFGGERSRYRDFLRSAGLTEEEALVQQRLQALRDDRLAAVVQASRTADPKTLHALFDWHYGVDGLRVQVRHVLVAHVKVRNEIAERRRGATVSEAEVERVGKERIDALRAQLDAGTPFERLVAASDDPRGRTAGGDVPGYNFQEFGVEFATAVRALEPGKVSPPVRSTHGWHLIQLVSATLTQFADVQPELHRLLREEPPSLAELQRTRAALLERVGFTRER